MSTPSRMALYLLCSLRSCANFTRYIQTDHGKGGGGKADPPPQTARFDIYTPVLAVLKMSRLCRAHLCPTLSFEGMYYWFLLFSALQSLACHHCP